MSWPWKTHPGGGSGVRGGGGRGPAGSRPRCTIACCTLAHRTLHPRPSHPRRPHPCPLHRWLRLLAERFAALPNPPHSDSRREQEALPGEMFTSPPQQKDRWTDTSTRFSKHGAIWLARDQDPGRRPRPPLWGHPAISPQFWQGYARTRKCFMIVKTVVWKTLVFQSSTQLGSPCAA